MERLAMEPLVALLGITKRHRLGEQSVQALSDVSLAIRRGEFVSVTGPSGSGKSTLLSILGSLERPSYGQYLLDG
jgi:putative ABC transport system ATP-binding protein